MSYSSVPLLDGELLGDLYGTEEVRLIFSARSVLQTWLDVEAALAAAEAEAGVLPAEAAERIAREANADEFDLAELRDAIASTKHPLVPVVRSLVERCGEHGGWVHWGVTTQDVLDTGLILQARAALVPVERDVNRCVNAAAALARRYRDTPMAGRTHGQHAVPITFGLKAATWADELGRARDRLREAADSALVAQLSGAAGTLASLGEQASLVQELFCARLDLKRPDVHWHATRDRLRDLVHALAQIASAAERIVAEVVRLEATETQELFEPTTDKHVGSSTMPQKRNPMMCEYVIASARLVRGSSAVLFDAPHHAHERDMGLWAAEWVAVPQAFILSSAIVDKLAQILEGLEVNVPRMRANLDLTGGQIMGEAVMMALGPALGHEKAHQLVLTASRRATVEGTPMRDALHAVPEIAAHLTLEEIERLLEPTTYAGLAPASADAVVKRVTGGAQG